VGDRRLRCGDDARPPAARHSGCFGGACSFGFADTVDCLPAVEVVVFFFVLFVEPCFVV